MSTKCSVKYEHDTETGLGFHLYTDWLDRCAGSDVVSLQLDGVEFEATAYNGGTSVTVTIPARHGGAARPCPASRGRPNEGELRWPMFRRRAESIRCMRVAV